MKYSRMLSPQPKRASLLRPRLRRRRTKDVRPQAVSFGVGAVIGAGLARLTDPSTGKRRRRMVRDRGAALLHRGIRRSRRSLHHGSKDLYGLGRRVLRHLPHERRELDDATLRDKVQSILFRDRRIPKGQISVNVERGWIYLRGQLTSPELIRAIGEQAARIDGVQGVKNLLHTP